MNFSELSGTFPFLLRARIMGHLYEYARTIYSNESLACVSDLKVYSLYSGCSFRNTRFSYAHIMYIEKNVNNVHMYMYVQYTQGGKLCIARTRISALRQIRI